MLRPVYPPTAERGTTRHVVSIVVLAVHDICHLRMGSLLRTLEWKRYR
jgi:hypothetical protein